VQSSTHDTIANSGTKTGNMLGAGKDQPNLGKLAQHKMENVLNPMEANVKADRTTLTEFLAKCG
jgi:hypothetical protein